MCLIIHRPIGPKGRGSNVPSAVLEANRVRNPDGFGIAWRDAKGIHSRKYAPGKQGYADFLEQLKVVDKRTDIEYTAHYRLATHGPACKELSHPFQYTDPKEGPVLVFHNGVIDINTDTTAVESDTSVYVQGVLAKLPSRWWADPTLTTLVEMSVGWSRLLVMTNRETVLLNRSSWHKKDGMVYSTTTGVSDAPATSYVYSGGSLKPTPDYKNDWDLPDGVTYSMKSKAYQDGDKRAFEKNWTPPPPLTEDDDELEMLLRANESSGPVSNPHSGGWMHQGHKVTARSVVDNTPPDENHMGVLLCEDCNAYGQYYFTGADGVSYGDITHIHEATDTFDDNEFILKPILTLPIPSAIVQVALQN